MTKDEKIAFIQKLTAAVAADLIDKVQSGAIPGDWDGHELREILARKFDRERSCLMSSKRGARRRDYDRVIAITPEL